MKNIHEKIFAYRNWLLLIFLSSSISLFAKIRTMNFSSPYFIDWISIALMIWIFWALSTISLILIVSLYYDVKSLCNPKVSGQEVERSTTISKKAFFFAFEFFNLMMFVTTIYIIYWIVLYLVCPFILIFVSSFSKGVLYSSIFALIIILVMIKAIKRTKIMILIKDAFRNCFYYVKNHDGKFFLYLAILSAVFPMCCYRFELNVNDKLFYQKDNSVLTADIILGGMTSAPSRLKVH